MSEQNLNNNQNLNDDNNKNEQIENKVFSEDYVKALRGEAKQHRLTAKSYETKLRQILNLKDDEDVTDLDTVINNYQENLTKAQNEVLNKAKELLYKTELQKYDNQYNLKLASKLLDKTKIEVADDGTITGLQEALKELEKEYPEIVKNSQSNGGANPVLDDKKTDKQENLFKKALGLF